ncbi:hypothetical protein OY671_011457, partial [Metschnikowia pulcherrima]
CGGRRSCGGVRASGTHPRGDDADGSDAALCRRRVSDQRERRSPDQPSRRGRQSAHHLCRHERRRAQGSALHRCRTLLQAGWPSVRDRHAGARWPMAAHTGGAGHGGHHRHRVRRSVRAVHHQWRADRATALRWHGLSSGRDGHRRSAAPASGGTARSGDRRR